jgi:biotin synthase
MHGLNVARQPDNAANPRPDNRSGWLSGETPDVVGALLAGRHRPAAGERAGAGDDGHPTVASPPGELKVRLWDPSAQLRYRAKGPAPVAGWGD